MSEVNEDKLEPPAFLNKEYFKDILKSIEKDNNIELANLKVTPAADAGHHYGSIMFKVAINYTVNKKTQKKCFWILKTMPLAGNQKDLLDDIPVFRNEIQLYTKILPRMQQILRQAGDNEEIAPKFIHQSMKPPVVILEDISKLGYTDSHQTLNFENLKLVANKIAKYHALSLVIDDEKSEDVHFESMFTGNAVKDQFKKMTRGINCIAAQLKTCSGFEEIGMKLEGSEDQILDGFFDVHNKKRPFGYSVLNHGDFHIGNMMFQKNGDEFKNVLFLDFQCPFWGTPAVDLYYLIHMIGDVHVFDRKYEMIRFYYDKFCSYLKKFGYVKFPPSLLDLNIEITKYGPMELMIVCVFAPMLQVDRSDIDLGEMFAMTEDKAQRHAEKLFSHPAVVAKFKQVLPIFFYKGYMDW